MIIHRIDDLTFPGLEPYRTMRRPEEHEAHRIFVAEGEKVVRRLLRSGLGIRSFLLTGEWFSALRPEIERRVAPGAEVFLAPHPVLEGIVGFRFHQGVMAVGEVPPEPPIDQLPQPHLLVALERIHHVENVGVIIRNAAGLGADGVVIGETSCSPFLRRAVRNSMGAVFSLRIHRPASLRTCLVRLRERSGTRLLVADPHAPRTVWEEDLRGNFCLIVGNEDAGVSEEIRALADGLVAIPMRGEVDSLNAASAAAVILAEAGRQRKVPREADREFTHPGE